MNPPINYDTLIYGWLIINVVIFLGAAFFVWIDSKFPEQDEHTDTDNSRG